ncbi:hypothetical protein [Candidatus Viridilinea mediisalina]|uniref:hypothetical protein n=1 Tax=Candidatus Viridilinea mediisalina TaxID=2024553 RepID=UPI001FEC1682|nr:hypothetical protein [Candidatus Viridilinea mediisalina]
MMQVVSPRPPTAAGLALLPLKLVSPAPRSETLLRPDLQALLAEVRLRPATLVVAPAGYGKTTLMIQWVADLERTGATVAWVSLDADDSAPAMLLAYLVRAFQRQRPEVGEEAWRILHSAAQLERDWPLVAGALMSDLQTALVQPTFLCIDDYHQIADGPITGALLTYMLRAAPPNLHIVVASRRPLDLTPLHRMRAEGLLLEVQRNDLSLTRDEAATLLRRARVELNAEDLDLLLQHTEGWVLSVQLAARALAQQQPEQRRAYLQSIYSSQRSIFDYLASEVLDGLSRELLDVLAQTALADQFDAELLSEVLGCADSQELIDRILQLGLPISQVETGDAEVRAYRFHPLWGRLLHERAEQHLGRTRLAQLHLRYGAAFERRSMLEAAMNHYTAAGNDEALAGALRRRAWPLIDTPQRATIRAWLERLPEHYRLNDPELLHMWGWSMAASARDQALNAISKAAKLYREQSNHQREMRALSDLAALVFWEDCPAEFADVCVRAVYAANHVRDAWARGAALASAAALLYNRGRYAAALRVANHASAHPRSPFWQWMLAMIVAAIHSQQGYPEAAATAVAQALEMPQVERDDRLHQNLLLLNALALYQQGRLNDAVAMALHAHRRLSAYSQESVIGVSAAFLALLLVEQGRFEEAPTYIARARRAANASGAATLLARIQVIDAYSNLRSDQGSSAVAALDLVRLTRVVGGDADPRGTTPGPPPPCLGHARPLVATLPVGCLGRRRRTRPGCGVGRGAYG